MITLYCIVHKDDAAWLVGEKLDGCTNHAIKHKLYDLNNVRDALQQKNMVCISIKEGGVFEAFNPCLSG